MAIRIREGRWALSRIISVPSEFPGGDSSFAVAAMRDRLAPTVEAYYPPMNEALNGYTLPFALVRLQGAVTPPPNADTRLIPQALVDATLRDLTAQQRQRLASELAEWMPGYEFRDYDGSRKTKQAFSAAGYTLDTPVRRVLLDLFEHMGHSETRPRAIVPESHNTEYLDDFSTDPFAAPRWTNEIGGSAWDSVNSELDCDNGTGQPWGVRYSVNGPGSIEHEAQVTGINNGNSSVCGGAACRFDTGGVDDWYLLWIQDWSNQNLVWLSRMNAGTRTDLASYAFTVADNDWFTHRMAVSGAAGATAVVDTWITNHGATKPSDPGWYGVDGTPDQSYSDTSASRLDDAAHGHCGISGRTGGLNFDTRHCFWKSRAISDRSGGGVTEEGDFSGPVGFGSTFSAEAIAAASLTAGIGCGATFSGRTDAIAFVTAGLGAGDAAGRVKGVVADAAAEVLAGATTSALADAIAAVLAAAELGEQWAGQALTAASLAAAGEFGAEFTEATSGTTGAVVAGTELAAAFVAAAETLASTVAGASLDDAFAAIAMAMGHVTAGAVFGAAFTAAEDNQQEVEVGLSLGHAIDVAAIALGSLAAGVGLQAVVAAVSVSRAEVAAGATFGAAFSAIGGVGEILPPAHASLRLGPRTRDLRVPPRIRSTRIN